MKVGMFLGKVKKFGIGCCIPHRVAAVIASNRVKYKTCHEKNWDSKFE